ncbi:hypothetical protein NA57DRAFT_52825 [Rhizodiscina lignyota]|uniref:Glutamyl-tRNA synthetase n=1 Tax=Rhizodiscina lignyota TaxID=1504668 RepID=A0A9P4IQ21_9PEZI|nr:hypothetical protein NA57DRAFT_52825 [Rhizodiscina lignyota]
MSTPYEKAVELIDEAHKKDPKIVKINSEDVPYELHYAQKMSEYLVKRSNNASDTLRIAIRAQHFRRWEVPRDSYPMTRVGYHAWRTYLKKRQAEQVERICLDCGFAGEDAERVASLIRKEDLKEDEETQILEDVACLVFLEDQFADFEKEHNEDKIITILRKTWAKMSKEGQDLALQIPMTGRPQELVQKALAG